MGERLWKIGGQIVDLSRRGWIMGALNVTPDSFSDGGNYFAPEKAVEHGLKMAKAGADVIDVGGEYTRPRAEPVSPEEELQRVIDVTKQVRANSDVVMQIDTSTATAAAAAID